MHSCYKREAFWLKGKVEFFIDFFELLATHGHSAAVGLSNKRCNSWRTLKQKEQTSCIGPLKCNLWIERKQFKTPRLCISYWLETLIKVSKAISPTPTPPSPLTYPLPAFDIGLPNIHSLLSLAYLPSPALAEGRLLEIKKETIFSKVIMWHILLGH